MQADSMAAKIKPRDSVRETINQDGAVLLDIKQGLCFSMNPAGAKIWQMLKRGNSITDIANALKGELEVPRSEIEADVAAFVVELRKRNLVETDVSTEKQGRSLDFSTQES